MATYYSYFSRPVIGKVPTAGLFIDGSDNDDTLNGSILSDEIHGRGGHDTLNGGGGDDFLFGEEGNDILNGGSGNDSLDGGAGNDALIGGAGADKFIGGADFDTVAYASASIGVTINMATAGISNDAQGDTYVGIERIVGSNFGDIINGDASGNILDGGNGEDWLFGGSGDDTLIGGFGGTNNLRGGAGDDVLIAGPGFDRLTGDDSGSAGFDHFVLTRDPTNQAVATITDFQSGFDRVEFRHFGTNPQFHSHLQFGSADPGTTYQFGSDFDGLVFDPSDHTLNLVFWEASGDQFHPFEIHSSVVVAVFTGGDLHQVTDAIFTGPPNVLPTNTVDTGGLLLA